MGANAQTTVQKFLSGAVLTAEQQNFSAATGVPVFATTVTRDAAFGGANKVLAEGQTCYLEDANVVQYYDGAAWATVGPAAAGALTLIKTQTIGDAVSTVEVTGAFSSTYDNYKILINGGVCSADTFLTMILGSTTTGYYWAAATTFYSSGAFVGTSTPNDVSFSRLAVGTTASFNVEMTVMSPNLAKATAVNNAFTSLMTTGYAGFGSGFLNNTTQYTAFTLGLSSGTITGGTIKVYGYANS